MTELEKERLEQIESLLMRTVKRKNACLAVDNIEEAERLKQTLLRLDREKHDILEGRKEIMDERYNYLLDLADRLNKELEYAGFFKRIELKKQVNAVYDAMDEFALRNYARKKVKEKTLDKH